MLRCMKKGVFFIWCLFFLSTILNLSIVEASEFKVNTIDDYGNITVMEVEGNYDATLPDGTINEGPRQTIAKEFFRLHKDEYDFLVIFTNFNFQMPEEETKAFYHPIKNDVRGIGIDEFDYSALYGSNGRLQGIIDMGNINGLGLTPFEPGFEETLSTLSHEMLHRWGAYVRFRDGNGNVSNALLGRGGDHWSFLLDTDGSVLYGNDWQDNGDGTFTSVGTGKYYSPLDLYLMGFIDRTRVPPMLLIDNPSIEPARLPEKGVTIKGEPQYVTIDDIIAVEGERIPDVYSSQKSFKMAFILLTLPGTFRIEGVFRLEDLRNEWITRFSVLTDGMGIVQVTSTLKEELPENPGVIPPVLKARRLPPDIEDGIRWLMRHQDFDGSWVAIEQTTERDTAEAVLALSNFEMAFEHYLKGLQWLEKTGSRNMDYLVRKVMALTEADRDVTPLIDEILSRQNSDGGWGSGATYMSNPVDTSFALMALAVSGYSGDPSVLIKAIEYLKDRQNEDGGWGSDHSSTVQATTNVLMAFNRYRDSYPLEEYIQRGTQWLMAHQNPDGGFGNSPSTVYDTALSVLALRELNVSTEITNRSLSYLLDNQTESGSWYESPYQTALAVRAVWKANIDPDLSIKAEDISFIPSSVTSLPSDVVITARVWNNGRTGVSQAKVALYRGAISETTKLAEQTLAFPGQSATSVTFPITVKDRNSDSYIIVVDPDNNVKESSETNNQASRYIYLEPTYDFVVTPQDISLSSEKVKIYDNLTITADITNRGTSDAYNLQVRIFIDLPEDPYEIATLNLDVPAGETVTAEYKWDATVEGVSLPLTVEVDPIGFFSELSEDNNRATVPLTVEGATEPNLMVSYKEMVFTPEPAKKLGDLTISVPVKNNGFSDASGVVVEFYLGIPGVDGALIGRQTIEKIAPGENRIVSVLWQKIPVSGEKTVYVTVDPDNLISEIKEDDNEAFRKITILDLPDLAVSTNSITFEPSAPKEGDRVSINVIVKNMGGRDVQDVTVDVYGNNKKVGTEVIPLIGADADASVSFVYDTTGMEGAHEITVKVDPLNLIVEKSEDNNQASRVLGVQDADLWVSEPYISPNGDGIKDSTDFFFRLRTPQTVEVVVIDGNGSTVRVFSGPELTDTTGTTITWDGIDSEGRVVADGQYRIEVVDRDDNVLGGLSVVVDNNRLPFKDAIGTDYLWQKNMTCMLPQINPEQWKWLPDESGIVFWIDYEDSDTPEYPAGLYRMAPDGEDIKRLIPDDWNTSDNPEFIYYNFRGYPSPDSSKVAFLFWKVNRKTQDLSFELWTVDVNGERLNYIDSISPEAWYHGFYNILWSPDGNYLGYIKASAVDDYVLYIVNINTLERIAVDSQVWYTYEGEMAWSPDSTEIAYQAGECDQNYNCYSEIRVADIQGNKRALREINGLLYWFAPDRIVLWGYGDRDEELWLIDTEGDADKRIAESTERYISISPDHRFFAFVAKSQGILSLYLSDIYGNIKQIERLTASDYRCLPYFSRVIWDRESKRIAFMKTVADNDAICSEPYGPFIELFELDTNGSRTIAISSVDGTDVRLNGWLSDGVTIILTDPYQGIFAIDTNHGTEVPILSGYYRDVDISPLERYVTFYRKADSSSICYNKGSNDIWSISSLLNLTVEIRVKSETSHLILKGTATDLYFEGYKLEYADVKEPDRWVLIKPPSDLPVVNDVITVWVPPHKGRFYVRLTAWDRAGNVLQRVRQISWGKPTGIIGLYLTETLFSPNGDGVKDSVELHYKVLDPVHLEFYIYDERGTLIRTFYRDYTETVNDFIVWDGRDDAGNLVSDGLYKIRVFNYEFFVEVDNTLPDINISFSNKNAYPLGWWKYIKGYSQPLWAHVVDKNLKEWRIELGFGDNPERWYRLMGGSSLVSVFDPAGTPLDPPKDILMASFGPESSYLYDFHIVERMIGSTKVPIVKVRRFGIGMDLDWLNNARLRLSASDSGGNRITMMTGFIPERMFIYKVKNDRDKLIEILKGGQIIGPPGVYRFYLQETIREKLDSITVQYMRYWFVDEKRDYVTDWVWNDGESISGVDDGKIEFLWDSSDLESGMRYYVVRFKAVDEAGQEYYSNEVRMGNALDLYSPSCAQMNRVPSFRIYNLIKDLLYLKLQIKAHYWGDDPEFAEWTDFKVWDISKGDEIPEGFFEVEVPVLKEGVLYNIRIVGKDEEGIVYSRETSYPNICVDIEIEPSTEEMPCNSLKTSIDFNVKITVSNPVLIEPDTVWVTFGEQRKEINNLDVRDFGSLEISFDSSLMSEGNHLVNAGFIYRDLVNGITKEATIRLPSYITVDHTPPEADILSPPEGSEVCPVEINTEGKRWSGIPVEGVATDNLGGIYFLQVKKEDGQWATVSTFNSKGESVPLRDGTDKRGLLGIWDVSGLKDRNISLRLKVIDRMGNVSCDETHFLIDKVIEINSIKLNNTLFSPNGDQIMDDVTVYYNTDEAATVDIKVYPVQILPNGDYYLNPVPIRTVASGLKHPGGYGEVIWYGIDDSGGVVPDGIYGIVVNAIDSCSNAGQKGVYVEVDNTAPYVEITKPMEGDPIGNIVEVWGTVRDPNLAEYHLEAINKETGKRISFSSGTRSIDNEVVGRWSTAGLSGSWELVLTATDKVGNKSSKSITVNLADRVSLIKDLKISPEVFSPNGDGRLDKTVILYELTDGCIVDLEIINDSGAVVKRYRTSVDSAGVYKYTWDGTDMLGDVVQEGEYKIKLIASLLSNTTVREEEAITGVVDYTPPRVDITTPLNDSYLDATEIPVVGTISDENLLYYSIINVGPSGEILIDEGSQSREAHTFGILNELPEGQYRLKVVARDSAENTEEKTIVFVLDRTPPEVLLLSPVDGEIYGGREGTVEIKGSITERNLETYIIRYTSVKTPLQWKTLARSEDPPQGDILYQWRTDRDVVEDGIYVLSLYAKDLAGHEAETRVKITIDNTVPLVYIKEPEEGQYIKGPVEVLGTVDDLSLDRYEVEFAEGECSGAYRWAVLGVSNAVVQDGVLAKWLALPEDGDYCVRLTAVDKLEQKTATSVNVRVDTHPPQPPDLSGETENRTDVRLRWTANTEPDLAGYNLYRNGMRLNGELITEIQYIDRGLAEGSYTYTVKAVDRAGWESGPSNEVKIKVDLTGPSVRIGLPEDGSRIGGLVDIKGTAFSRDDFKEYRLYMGRGSMPDSWSLLRRSPLPISYGVLGKMDTTGLKDGEVYTIKLEAEDIVGNINTTQVTTTVDNTPPSAPVLLTVVADGEDVTVTWSSNTEPDLAGYLLYRNDELANSESVVIGNLFPYVLSETVYFDEGLPDGRFRYYVVAMDEAGNMSEESNAIEVAIDTHPPHAVIVEPEDGERFEKTIVVRADTADLDIKQVRFEYRSTAETTWTPLASADTPPYIVNLNPEEHGLTYGEYNLRAVATDEGGNTDPTPGFITVVYTDLTPPEAPVDLKARTDGRDVILRWTAGTESDLQGYNIYRIHKNEKVKLNTVPLDDTVFYDRGLADGFYTYEVTAVDIYTNESRPSNRAEARVYAPVINQPYTPAADKVVQIEGEKAEPDATVEVFVDAISQGTTTSDENGHFTFDVILNPGENRITARSDKDGNRSRLSEQVVIVYNEPPAAPAGLVPDTKDYTVTLTWDPNTEPDLVGYNVYRGDERLNRLILMTSGTVVASSYYFTHEPGHAFDGDPSTYWMTYSYSGQIGPQWLEIDLPTSELINTIEVQWESFQYSGNVYEIQVWTGYTWIIRP